MQSNHHMIVKASRRLCGTGVLALILSAPAAQAGASISGNYVGATAPTLDNTYGTLEFALNMGGNALSRDGIAFTTAGTGGVAPARIFLSNGGGSSTIDVVGTTSGGASWGATTLGGGADPLFYTVTYANDSTGYTIDISDLDAGKSYQLQFLFGDPRNGNYPHTRTVTVSDNLASTDTAIVTYGKTGLGDEFAMLTAVVSGSTSFKFTSPNTGVGTGAPLLSGLVVHSVAPSSGQPVSTNDSLTLAEDTHTLLTINDFGTYSDPGSQPLSAVKITTLPSTGSLEYYSTGESDWVLVDVAQEISVADITAGRLRFSPAENGNGSPYTTVGFRVGNGTELSLASYILTLNVTPINDYEPTSADNTVGVAQGVSKTLSAVNFAFADADGNDTLQKIQVTQLPTVGTLALNAVAVTLNQEIPVADINAGLLKFTSGPTASGSAYATFGFKVSDGTFYSVVSSTMTVDIVPVLVTQSATRIPFVNSGTLVGAAVFGPAGTYDGIPFSLWNTPFATPLSLGSGVSVTLAITGGAGGGSVTGGAFGTSQQYQFGAYPNSTPRGMTLTFTGLDSSRQYRFQFGYGDTRTIYAYNENATVTLDVASPPAVSLAFGSAAAGDEYALLTATATNTTTLVLTLPQTVSGNHGPMQAGFSVHTIGGATAYDTWADGTFANGTLSDKTPGGDPDGDGLTNQKEFAYGLDPTTGASSNPISQQLNKGSGIFKYTRTKSSGLTYIYQYSTTLSEPWVSFESVTTPPPVSLSATVEEVTIEMPAALITANPGKLFVRVKAQ